MKKIVFLAVCLAVLTTGAFAFELSAFRLSVGGGGDVGGVAVGLHGTERIGFGGFVFVDATYAEFSFGYYGGKGTSDWDNFGDEPISFGALNIALLGKFPFRMAGESFGVDSEYFAVIGFPLVGVEYQVMLFQNNNGTANDNAGDMSALWIRFGFGADFVPSNSHAYCRLEALGGIRLASKADNDFVDAQNASGLWRNEVKYNLGFGYQVKVALGYKFGGGRSRSAQPPETPAP